MKQSDLYRLYDREPEPIVDFLAYLRKAYDIPRPGHVLDMGCGPGRLLGPLVDAGWVVTGYEPDPDYAEAARDALGSRGRFVQGGFLDLNEIQAYDLVIAVNGPYSYVLDPASRLEALRRAARALRAGGVLLLELSNFHWILKHYREPSVLEADIDGVHVTRTAKHDIDYHRGTFTHYDRFTWVDQDGVPREALKTHRMAMVPFQEIEFFLREAGLEDVRTFNEFSDREPAELTGRRMLITAMLPWFGSGTRSLG